VLDLSDERSTELYNLKFGTSPALNAGSADRAALCEGDGTGVMRCDPLWPYMILHDILLLGIQCVLLWPC
jgi:hypothetical protein